MVRRPFKEPTCSQKILIIFLQLRQARASYICELDLHFLRCPGGLAAFDDVLFSRARGLDHLVHRAVALTQKARAEKYGGIKDDLRFLIGAQPPVTTVRWDKATFWGVRHRDKDRKDKNDVKDNHKNAAAVR
jgi:hypothetical protein